MTQSEPPQRIPVAQPKLCGNEIEYALDAISSGWISSIGEYIGRFEDHFSRAVGSQHAASCSNGTVALHLALLAIGIGPGDEVIVPTLTYIATANAVRYCGAVPVFVDCERDTLNLDPEAVDRAVSPRTKAVIAVHLYGHPADMASLKEICDRRHLHLVEDAAEALGATAHNNPVGSIGDIATFSFFGNKIVTTGEGGMVTTNSEELDARVRLLKGQGQDPRRRYWFEVVGYNYRMTNVAAAIGLAQLEQLDLHLSDRRRVARWYDEALSNLDGVIRRPVERAGYTNVYWLYTIILDDCDHIDRDTLIKCLDDDGIETRPVFYPMHHMPPYFDSSASMPVAERAASRGLSLPSHGHLSESDVDRIATKLQEYIK